MNKFDIIRLANKYVGNMHTYLKENSVGDWSIIYREATEHDCILEKERIKLNFNFRDYLELRPNKYTYLCNKDIYMMSDTNTEIFSNLEFLWKAKGDILIGGLGLGIMPLILSKMEGVKSVTIIEKEQDVIDLVWKQLRCSRHIDLVRGDVFTYDTDRKFDVVYMDIWADLNQDTDSEAIVLEEKYKNYLSQNGFILSWEQKIPNLGV
ncbi:MAG: hypothetical protein M0R03_20245 [Novosphingobium sp.]|nr:hypothetical protein [Novosphingobium sp.]